MAKLTSQPQGSNANNRSIDSYHVEDESNSGENDSYFQILSCILFFIFAPIVILGSMFGRFGTVLMTTWITFIVCYNLYLVDNYVEIPEYLISTPQFVVRQLIFHIILGALVHSCMCMNFRIKFSFRLVSMCVLAYGTLGYLIDLGKIENPEKRSKNIFPNEEFLSLNVLVIYLGVLGLVWKFGGNAKKSTPRTISAEKSETERVEDEVLSPEKPIALSPPVNQKPKSLPKPKPPAPFQSLKKIDKPFKSQFDGMYMSEVDKVLPRDVLKSLYDFAPEDIPKFAQKYQDESSDESDTSSSDDSIIDLTQPSKPCEHKPRSFCFGSPRKACPHKKVKLNNWKRPKNSKGPSFIQIPSPTPQSRMVELTHNWTIDNFLHVDFLSLTPYVDSPPFGNNSTAQFFLRLYPRISRRTRYCRHKCKDDDYDISLYLHMKSTNVYQKLTVGFTCSFLNKYGSKVNTKEIKAELNSEKSIGWDCFHYRDSIIRNEDYYLPNSQLTVFAKVWYDKESWVYAV